MASIPLRSFAQWADFYAVSRRTLERWVVDGKTAGKPCPYERPESMLEWWNAVKKNRAPSSISAVQLTAIMPTQSASDPVELAGILSGDDSARIGKRNRENELAKVVEKLERGDVLNRREREIFDLQNAGQAGPEFKLVTGGLGLKRAVERAQRAEASLGEAYLLAIEKREWSAAESLKKDWKDAAERLRKMEASFASVRQKGGGESEEYSAAAVAAMIAEKCAGIHRRLSMELAAIFPAVRRLAQGNGTEEEWSRMSSEFASEFCTRLTQTRFNG